MKKSTKSGAKRIRKVATAPVRRAPAKTKGSAALNDATVVALLGRIVTILEAA